MTNEDQLFHLIDTNAIVLQGAAVEAVREAVMLAQRRRRRERLPESRTLNSLVEVLNMSAAGQSDIGTGMEEHAGEQISIEEAATMLKLSARQVRRIAPQLGGQLVGGRWLLDRLAVLEHSGDHHA
ncbi:hypothetical protein [Antrihabitans sp. YC2-6]|uniref:hypothetical protein n=1 Tax=Antrihabitans sp. YC2-6 TaxID=2799498 RepID=UPI0018F65B55|nr:hypothetical protein [Antrihabitans sp. YC2-6]MBJ8344830.1 hypothetical protein [Antrihabitans sp. YC2-6]